MGLISSLKSNLQRPRLTTTMRDFLRQKINAIGSLVHVGGVRLTHQGREYIQIWINDDCRDILEIYVWCDMKAFKYFKYASENSERQRGQHSIRGLRVHCTNLEWGNEERDDCFKTTWGSRVSVIRHRCKLCFCKSFLYEPELLNHLKSVHKRDSIQDNVSGLALESADEPFQEKDNYATDSDSECERRAIRRKPRRTQPRTIFYGTSSALW